MKRNTLLIVILFLFSLYACKKSDSYTAQQDKQQDAAEVKSQGDSIVDNLEEPLKTVVKNIQWFGQASVKIINGNKVIYIDPYNLKTNDKVDFIFITHSHGDRKSVV